MNVGDRIELDDISGEVIASDEVSYSVRWDTSPDTARVLTYFHGVEWEEIGKVVRAS